MDEEYFKKYPGQREGALGSTAYENGRYVIRMNYDLIKKYNLPPEATLRHELGHVGSRAILAEKAGGDRYKEPMPRTQDELQVEETRQRLTDQETTHELPSLAMHSSKWRERRRQVDNKIKDIQEESQHPEKGKTYKDAQDLKEEVDKTARERLSDKGKVSVNNHGSPDKTEHTQNNDGSKLDHGVKVENHSDHDVKVKQSDGD
jgi:hypothetical protein